MIPANASTPTAAHRRAGLSFALGSAAALIAATTVWLLPWATGGRQNAGFGLNPWILQAFRQTGLSSADAAVTAASVSFSASFITALGCGLAAAWVGSVVQPRKIAWSLVAAGCLLTVTQSVLMAFRHTLWEPLPAILAMIAGCLAASWRNALPAGASAWFKGRVSPEMLARLAQAHDLSFLSADQRPGTVLTCRLLNEGALREILPAPDFLKLCEDFRARASAALLTHGACIDPTESTGVRAFFGLPLASETAADEAVKAALALEAAFSDFTAAATTTSEIAPTPTTTSSAPIPIPVPQCGAGLATGIFTAGLTGNQYTVFGDAVEISRWLASQNAGYQTRTLLDNATHLRSSEIEDRPLEVLNPPDGAAMEIFHLLGTTGTLSLEQLARRDAFRDAIVLLRAGHASDALRRFADAREGLTEPDPALEQFEAQANDQARRDAANSAQTSGSTPNPGPVTGTPAPLPLPLPPPLFPPRRRNTLPRKLPRP